MVTSTVVAALLSTWLVSQIGVASNLSEQLLNYGHRVAQLRPNGIDVPLEHRLHQNHPRFAQIMSLHGAACAKGEPCYRDPATGLSVMTAAFLATRGYCCSSGCRHCPYEQGA